MREKKKHLKLKELWVLCLWVEESMLQAGFIEQGNDFGHCSVIKAYKKENDTLKCVFRH